MIKILVMLFLFSCDDQDPEKHGCMDSQACNYDAEATVDLFPDSTCVYEVDCNGVCGGDGVDSDNDGQCDD